jgi:hypothetical protein
MVSLAYAAPSSKVLNSRWDGHKCYRWPGPVLRRRNDDVHVGGTETRASNRGDNAVRMMSVPDCPLCLKAQYLA